MSQYMHHQADSQLRLSQAEQGCWQAESLAGGKLPPPAAAHAVCQIDLIARAILLAIVSETSCAASRHLQRRPSSQTMLALAGVAPAALVRVQTGQQRVAGEASVQGRADALLLRPPPPPTSFYLRHRRFGPGPATTLTLHVFLS